MDLLKPINDLKDWVTEQIAAAENRIIAKVEREFAAMLNARAAEREKDNA